MIYKNKEKADLCKANLCEANLREADLCGADLCEADLRGADLRGADLREADLRGANLRGANLYGANLREANLCEADLRGADLCGADLCGANLEFVTWPLWCGSFNVKIDDKFLSQLLYHWAKLDVSNCSKDFQKQHENIIQNNKNLINLFCNYRKDIEQI